MSSAASMGVYTKIALAATGSSSWSRFPKLSCSVAKRGGLVIPDMTTGKRARPVEINRSAPYTVGGDLSFNCTPALLNYTLPYLTGDPSSPFVNQEPAGALLPTFQLAMDKGGQMHSYSGLAVDRGVFSFNRGELLSCALSLEGIDEAVGGSSALSLSALNALSPSLSAPYIFYDAVVTVGGTSYAFMGGTFSIDNMLDKNQFYGGSQVRSSLPSTDLHVSVSLSVPYNSTNKALYDTGATDAAVVITATNGSNVFAITLPSVQFPAQPIGDPGRGEIVLPLEGTASSSAGGSVFSITHT